MRVIHVPMSEMLCPPKKRRKFRCRSARHACEKSLGPDTGPSDVLCSRLFSVMRL